MVDSNGKEPEGEGNDEGRIENNEKSKKTNTLFNWFSLVEAVEEITKFNYEQVMNMEIVEFLVLCTYAFFKAEKQKAELNKFNNIKSY